MQETVNDIVEILDKSILPAFAAFLLASIVVSYIFIKNENTYRQHAKIDNAILRYQLCCIKKKVKPLVNYSDVERYAVTLRRLWDWGYTNILPKEKFELIKPFIKEEKK